VRPALDQGDRCACAWEPCWALVDAAGCSGSGLPPRGTCHVALALIECLVTKVPALREAIAEFNGFSSCMRIVRARK
jgi:hypothetical protein